MYSAFGSFYIPSCIMVFVYIKIYFAARERARRNIKMRRKSRRKSNRTFNPPAAPPTIVNPQVRMAPPPGVPASTNNNNNHNGGENGSISATVEIPAQPPSTSGLPSAMKRHCSGSSDSVVAEKKTTRFSFDTADIKRHQGEASEASERVRLLAKAKTKKVVQIMTSSGSMSDSQYCDTPDTNVSDTQLHTEPPGPSPTSTPAPSPCSGHACMANGTKARRSIGVQSVKTSANLGPPAGPPADTSEDDRASNSDSGKVRCLKLRTRFKTPRRPSKETREMLDVGRLGRKKNPGGGGRMPAPSSPSTVVGNGGVSVTGSGLPPPRPTEADIEKEKKRVARKKERRATLILGLIMGSFIACWFPFFFLYSISPVCPICEEEPDSPCCVRAWGFSFAFWLGYSNSALNPVIYTIFNKDFRRAFKRILFK